MARLTSYLVQAFVAGRGTGQNQVPAILAFHFVNRTHSSTISPYDVAR